MVQQPPDPNRPSGQKAGSEKSPQQKAKPIATATTHQLGYAPKTVPIKIQFQRRPGRAR